MSKYDALGKFLSRQKNSNIPMTFREIEEVVGIPLPRSSMYPAWWSNNSWNNVMTKIWLNAGFKTEQVNVTQRKLVFCRVPPLPPQHIGTSVTSVKSSGATVAGAARPYSAASQRHPIFGALKGTIRIVAGTDLTKPADADWGKDKS